MEWLYSQPVEIRFKTGAISDMGAILSDKGFNKGVLVCDPFFKSNGLADKVVSFSEGRIAGVYSEITPNPKVTQVDECGKLLKSLNADFVVALGGGSAMDCAKAAAALAVCEDDSIVPYHQGQKKLTNAPLPIIAVPTTAGTGAEVTCVAVLTDDERKFKAPLFNALMFPKMAIIDPELTVSAPPKVTASTGLDVLAHALEAFWSKNHQPVCDALALHATKIVFKFLKRAYDNGSDMEAREMMCEASVIAGLAFALPKTTGPHACSFPLTTDFGMPHGEACAFTLDAFARINANAENGRLEQFAKEAGFNSVDEMATLITQMKKEMGMKVTLTDAGIKPEDLDTLVEKCKHPNMLNNPVDMDSAAIRKVFEGLK